MARTDTLGHFLTDVADAIRTKKGTSDTIQASDFDTEIENLPSGGDLSEYFVEELNVSPSIYQGIIIKKMPDLVVSNNVTSLIGLYSAINKIGMPPKVICNNNITNMSYSYGGQNGLKYTAIDVSGLNTSNVTNMSFMFGSLEELENISGFNNFNTSKVTNMSYMFYTCSALNNLDLSSFDTSSVTNMNSMFYGCGRKANNFNLVVGSNFNTSNVTDMGSMFYNCHWLTQTPSWLKMQSVTSMYSMFEFCSNLTNADFSNTDLSNVTTINNCFNGCTQLMFLDLRSLDVSKITSYTNAFGSGQRNYIPANCEIIVADDTAKAWFNSNFSRLTNVKTVAEYEAEQNQ